MSRSRNRLPINAPSAEVSSRISFLSQHQAAAHTLSLAQVVTSPALPYPPLALPPQCHLSPSLPPPLFGRIKTPVSSPSLPSSTRILPACPERQQPAVRPSSRCPCTPARRTTTTITTTTTTLAPSRTTPFLVALPSLVPPRLTNPITPLSLSTRIPKTAPKNPRQTPSSLRFESRAPIDSMDRLRQALLSFVSPFSCLGSSERRLGCDGRAWPVLVGLGGVWSTGKSPAVAYRARRDDGGFNVGGFVAKRERWGG